MVTSDPHAWLRPIHRELAAAGSFEQLAPVTKFARLMDAAAAKKTTIRDRMVMVMDGDGRHPTGYVEKMTRRGAFTSASRL